MKLLFFTISLLLLSVAIPPIVQAQTCYVCDQGLWRKHSGTGECKEGLPSCKNNDSSTFEGCVGGDGKESGVCEEGFFAGTDPSLESSFETDLFTDKERMRAMVPDGEPVPDCEGLQGLINDDKCRNFWPSVFLPDGETGILDSAQSPIASTPQLPSGTGGIIPDSWMGFFQRFLALFVGKSGFLNFPKPEETPFPKVGGDKNAEFRGATKFLIESTLPDMSTYASMGTSADTSYAQVKSQTLSSFIKTAAESQCVPSALLLAILHAEGTRAIGYTEEEVLFFSKNNWWTEATSDQIDKGYCYDSCKRLGSGCLATDNVMGATQFNLNTWKEILPKIRDVVGVKFGTQVTDDERERCIVRNSIVATAVKLKGDAKMPEGQCTNWPDDVILRVARVYHGAYCETTVKTDYCQNVLRMYKSYSNLGQP